MYNVKIMLYHKGESHEYKNVTDVKYDENFVHIIKKNYECMYRIGIIESVIVNEMDNTSTNGNTKLSREYLLGKLKEINEICNDTECRYCKYFHENNCLCKFLIDTVCNEKEISTNGKTD